MRAMQTDPQPHSKHRDMLYMQWRQRQRTVPLFAETYALHAEAVASANFAGARLGANLGVAINPLPALHADATPNTRYRVRHAVAVHAAPNAAQDTAVIALKAEGGE